MIGVVNDCNKLELATSIETKDVKIYTNIGFLITNNYKLIIELCKRTFSKTIFKPSKSQDIVYSYENTIDNVNLVITSANKLVFWEEHKSDTVAVLDRKSMLTKDVIKDHFVVVVSTPLFLQNVQYFKTFAFKRIIFHNVENRYLHTDHDIVFDFKWFVFSDDTQIQSRLLGNPEFVSNILIKDENAHFIAGRECIIVCKKPIEVLTLDGLVDEVLMNKIKKGNIRYIIKHLVDNSIKSEKDIIKSVLRVLNDKMNNFDTYEYCLRNMYFANDSDRESKLKQITYKKDEISKKKSELIDRITENNLCFVCYCSMEIRCVMRCCVNKVCFECINRWARINNTCPLCKTNKMEYYVVEDDNDCEKEEGDSFDCVGDTTAASTSKRVSEISATEVSDEQSIFQNFRVLLNKLVVNGDSKIAILGSEKAFIHRFVDIVNKEDLPHVWFKGNLNTLRKNMRRLQHSEDMNIIFIDISNIVGAITIHSVTDIIVLSEDVCVNKATLISDNLKNIWRLVYS